MIRLPEPVICRQPVPICCLGLFLACSWPSAYGILAQETPPSAKAEIESPGGIAATGDPATGAAETVDQSDLGIKQESVAERFGRLEKLLLRSSELEADENPSRAALLQQAAQLGKQVQLADLLANAAQRIKNGQFTEAIEQQKTSREGLEQLLELLQRENREERVREERDQVRRWIEEVDRLRRLQGSLRGRTEGGQEAKEAAGDQGRLANKANDIAAELDSGQEDDSAESQEDSSQDSANSPESASDSDQGSSSQQSSEDQSSSQGTGNSESGDSESEKPESNAAGDETSGDDTSANEDQSKEASNTDETRAPDDPADDASNEASNKGESGQEGSGEPTGQQDAESEPKKGSDKASESSSDAPPQQGQSQQGQPQSGEQSSGEEQQPPQDPTDRARQQIQQAQQKMEEAQQDLENAQREGAVEKQREAEESLRKAIEELEEILRQLREEEIERSLSSLESRLRRMLDMQSRVLDETQRLAEIAGDGKPSRQIEIRASNLSLDERKILAEGERAYLLLREEGSSAAFPEAVEQLNLDIGNVSERLAQADVGRLTIFTEQEIVNSLEEMVAALVQVQKENKERKQQQQGAPRAGQPGEQPLVNKLAEIRLIKTLQLRINKRTGTLAQFLDDPSDAVGQVESGEILEQLKSLSERQSSIQTVTRDIVVGKGE